MNTKQMVVFFAGVIVSLALIKTLNIRLPINVTVSNTSNELAVVGEGKVDVVPDTAYVDVGITVSNLKTVKDAQDKVDGVHNALVGSLKKLGIASDEIKTSNYSISPSYSYENNISKIVGYDGNATLTIKTKKVDLVGKIVEEAAAAGANQIGNTRFTVDAPETYRESAREKAIANAKEQATKLAKTLGIRLGHVVNIVESTSGETSPIYSLKMADGMGGGAQAPSFESGTQTVTSTVTLYFEKQ